MSARARAPAARPARAAASRARAAQDNLMAALAMQRAAELAPSCAEFADDLARLLRRIPHQHADLLQVFFSRAHALVERCRRLPHECCTWSGNADTYT